MKLKMRFGVSWNCQHFKRNMEIKKEYGGTIDLEINVDTNAYGNKQIKKSDLWIIGPVFTSPT